MTELLIDPNIRVWVFLPIFVMTFLVGIIRHYMFILISNQKPIKLSQIQGRQALIRASLLRRNGKYLPETSYSMRKSFFNHEESGYFKTFKPVPAINKNSFVVMSEMMTGNFTNFLLMVIIRSWINWMFSGFVTTKVPFPLTFRFKPMLQRGVNLDSLDASWVSSASWYFLNVFGLRTIYPLVLGKTNQVDPMQNQIFGTAVAMKQDLVNAFKAEWEALEIYEYKNALKNVDTELLTKIPAESYSDY